MGRPATARTATRSRRQRGAAVLEMVLVTPLLVVLLFGVGEFGLAWVSSNRLEGAVSVAARAGSSQGASPNADVAILMQLQASLPEDLLANVTRVVVYKADADGDPHPQCLVNLPPNGVSGECNIYSGDTVRNPPDDLGSNDNAWDPATRRDRLEGPPDFLGVLVQTRHDDFSGTFWRDGFALERRAVYRIQPDVDG